MVALSCFSYTSTQKCYTAPIPTI